MIKAGELDRRLTFIGSTKTTNEYGETIETWGDLFTVWGSKVDDFTQSTDEDTEADRIVAIGLVAFTIRYRTGIHEELRIRCDGVEYDILAIAEVGRREGFKIRAERKT